MVEDEFVATAHRFTAHLHAAEYHRLRDMAKKQKENGSTFSPPPMTPSMLDNVKRSYIAKSLAISQHGAIKRAFSQVKDADEEDVDDTPWAGTHLHDIMECPRKKQIPLTRLAPVVTGTRAAALSRSQEACQRKQSQSGRSIPAGNRPAKAQQPQVMFATELAALSVERRGSIQQRGTRPDGTGQNDTAKSSASQADRPITQARKAISSTTTNTSNVDDDSDSSIENDFERIRRERRTKQPSVSRTKSSTPDASSQANLPSLQNQRPSRTTTSKTLSIPSI